MFSFLTIEQYSSTEDFCPAKTSFNEFKDENNYSSSNGYETNFHILKNIFIFFTQICFVCQPFTMFSWKWENKICSWFSKREESFYKSQFLRSQIHALRFLPGQWDDSREKQISPTPLQNPCRDGKWDYIHPLPLSLSWELGICCKKCNLSPKYHQSLTFSDYYEKMCTIFNQSHIF